MKAQSVIAVEPESSRVAHIGLTSTDEQAGARRTDRLLAITAALAQAVGQQQVFEAVVDQVAAALGASSAGLFQLRANGAVVELSHSIGYSAEGRRRLASVPLDVSPSMPVIDSIRAGRPVWLASQRELLEAYPHLESMVTLGRSYQIACLPILVGGQCRGAVAFTFDNAPQIDADQQGFLVLVARYCGQALERLQLLEAERRNRAAAEVAAARAGLLSQASRAFAEAATDVSSVLQAIMVEITEAYAEACGVSLVAGDLLNLAALHHRDPQALQGLRTLVEASPPRLAESASGQVVLTGKPLFMPVVEPEAAMLQAQPRYHAWLERYMPRSVIIVPLRARATIIGTLGAFRGPNTPCFTEQDVRFLEELGERAAMAIETSRLYTDNLVARQRTELLYGLSRAVLAADDVAEVHDAALDALEQALGASRAAILTFDAASVMRFRAWRGLSDAYRTAVEGHSPWPADVRDPEPIFVERAQSDPALAEYRALFARENIGALGFFPLIGSGKLVGKFMVYYDEPRCIRDHELQLARAIADQVAAATTRFAALDDLFQTVRFNEMFTGMLGHDLRNPLGAIMTATQLAMRRAPDERMTTTLARILRSGDRMARMIDQLLDFTRVRVGDGIPIQRQAIDLVPLLQHVIDELEGSTAGLQIGLEVSGNAAGAWDSDRLFQVFSNLVGNAVRHGQTGQRISVRVDGSDETIVQVTVHNFGVIAASCLPHLFEPMSGGEGRARSQGLGLGLYISEQIIQAHAGRIGVTSNERDGTTFQVLLPRLRSVMPERTPR